MNNYNTSRFLVALLTLIAMVACGASFIVGCYTFLTDVASGGGIAAVLVSLPMMMGSVAGFFGAILLSQAAGAYFDMAIAAQQQARLQQMILDQLRVFGHNSDE